MTKRPVRKISIHNLRVGMYVNGLDRSWWDTPFLFHNKKINNQEQIDKLIEHGIKEVTIFSDEEAYIKSESIAGEQDRKCNIEETVEFKSTNSAIQDSDPVELKEELPKARKIKSEVIRTIKHVFEDVRMGKSIEMPAIRQKVVDIVESIFRNRDALWSLSNLKNHDEYTFVHSVNVSIIVASLGRHLGLSRECLESAALGGLLHDIGKTKIPVSVLNKPGIYTEKEYNIMKRHVIFGAEILEQYKDIPDEAILMALQHHERFNGTGYNQKLSKEKISLAAQIASIADVYDAMTSDRIYRKAVKPHLIIKKLYEWADSLFDRMLIEKFIQCIGIYPYGTFVKLNRNYYGVVVSRNNRKLLRPTVLILFQGNKKISPAVIDLSNEIDRNGNYTYVIEEALDYAEFEVDINQVLSQVTL